jgi:hypothetical protein
MTELICRGLLPYPAQTPRGLVLLDIYPTRAVLYHIFNKSQTKTSFFTKKAIQLISIHDRVQPSAEPAKIKKPLQICPIDG